MKQINTQTPKIPECYKNKSQYIHHLNTNTTNIHVSDNDHNEYSVK